MEFKPKRKIPEFTSRLSNWECFGALIWLPVHLGVLPLLMSLLIAAGYIDATNANFICYAAGAVYMLLALGRYLRREFDPLLDAPLHAHMMPAEPPESDIMNDAHRPWASICLGIR